MSRARAAPFVLIASLALTLTTPVEAQAQWIVKAFGGVAASPGYGFVDLE